MNVRRTILRIDAICVAKISQSNAGGRDGAALGARKHGVTRKPRPGCRYWHREFRVIEAERTTEEHRTPDQRALLAQSTRSLSWAADDIVIAI